MPQSVADALNRRGKGPAAAKRPAAAARSGAAPRPPLGAAPRRAPARPADPLAAALRPAPKKRAKTTALERPVATFCDGGDDDRGPRRAAVPEESRVFRRQNPRATREAHAYCAAARGFKPEAAPRARRGPTVVTPSEAAALLKARAPPPKPRAPAAAAPAPPPSSCPWLAPVGADEAARLKGRTSRHAAAAAADAAAAGLKGLAQLERRETASAAATESRARAETVRCFACADCRRLFEARPPRCDELGHRVSMTTATRRLFCCAGCGCERHALERRPRGPCPRCREDRWKLATGEGRIAENDHAFRPALAEWTPRADVLAIVDI